MTNFAFLIFVYHFERIILDKKKTFGSIMKSEKSYQIIKKSVRY